MPIFDNLFEDLFDTEQDGGMDRIKRVEQLDFLDRLDHEGFYADQDTDDEDDYDYEKDEWSLDDDDFDS